MERWRRLEIASDTIFGDQSRKETLKNLLNTVIAPRTFVRIFLVISIQYVGELSDMQMGCRVIAR